MSAELRIAVAFESDLHTMTSNSDDDLIEALTDVIESMFGQYDRPPRLSAPVILQTGRG
jgi:hypothetical protein